MRVVNHLAALRPGPILSATASAKAVLRAIARRWLTLDADSSKNGEGREFPFGFLAFARQDAIEVARWVANPASAPQWRAAAVTNSIDSGTSGLGTRNLTPGNAPSGSRW